MSAIFFTLILGTYLSISFQDFRSREVYLITFFVLYVLYAFQELTRAYLNFDFIIINSCLLLAVISLLLMYYLIRYKYETFFRLKASVGWGDVLMLPAFIISFSPTNMILVFILSLVLAIIYYLIHSFRSSIVKTIPLAGIQSLVLSIFTIADFMGLLKMQIDFYPLL